MTIGWQEQLRPGFRLREVMQQATAALISMDAERLEELALCCADLNREIEETGSAAETLLVLREAAEDVGLLGRVLYETRANLTVLSRLHAIRIRESCVFRSGISRGGYDLDGLPAMDGLDKAAEYGDN